jgi:hypothetical protein
MDKPVSPSQIVLKSTDKCLIQAFNRDYDEAMKVLDQ